jgi:hypothetical protein
MALVHSRTVLYHLEINLNARSSRLGLTDGRPFLRPSQGFPPEGTLTPNIVCLIVPMASSTIILFVTADASGCPRLSSEAAFDARQGRPMICLVIILSLARGDNAMTSWQPTSPWELQQKADVVHKLPVYLAGGPPMRNNY